MASDANVPETPITLEIPTLSDECVSLIFSLMPIDNLPACAATCKQWAIVLREDGLLWSRIFKQCFSGSVEPSTARHACRRCMSTIRALTLTTETCPGLRKTRFSRRAGAAAGALGPHIVISGGATTHFEFSRHVDVWVNASDGDSDLVVSAVNPSGDEMPERWQHSAVSWGGHLWLYGGEDRRRGHPCGLLHKLVLSGLGKEYKPKIQSQAVQLERCKDDMLQPSVKLPLLHWPHEGPAVTGHTARLVEDGQSAYMLSFGGKAAGGPITNLLWSIHLTQQTNPLIDSPLKWRLLQGTGPAPQPRYCHSAVIISRGWLMFGGWAQGQDRGGLQLNEGTVFLNDLHVLELPSMSWCVLDPMGSVPRGRCQSVMVAAPDEEIILVFGGACHHDPKPGQAYGDMVMDLCDIVLLHLPTRTWLPQKDLPSNYQQRGGTNTLICTAENRRFIFGGMNSEEGNDEPNFLNNLTELVGLQAGAAQ